MSAILQSQPTTDLADRSNRNGVLGSLGIAACLMVIAMVIAVHFDSRVQRWRANKGLPPIEMGVVNGIELVDARGHQDTQVITDLHMLYLEGAATLRPGEVLEWRRSELHGDLCVVGTDRCWDLLVGNGG